MTNTFPPDCLPVPRWACELLISAKPSPNRVNAETVVSEMLRGVVPTEVQDHDAPRAARLLLAEVSRLNAELQQQHEAHRKTWRQLEQVTGLLREAYDQAPEMMGEDWATATAMALSQQAEPATPFDMNEFARRAGRLMAEHDFHGFEPVALAIAEELLGAKAEPAPAQDERAVRELLAVLNRDGGQHQHKVGIAQAALDAMDEVDRLRQAIAEQPPVAWRRWQATNDGHGYWVLSDSQPPINAEPLYATRPAQTEQQPVRLPQRADTNHGDAFDTQLAEAYNSALDEVARLNAAPIAQTAPQGKFRFGDLVRKTTGSEWEGHICGTYSTEQTPEGYAVESSAHRGSVQIYPAKALELVPMDAKEA